MFKVILGVLAVAGLSAGICVYQGRERHDSIWWENEVQRTGLIHQVQVAKFRLASLDKGCSPAVYEAAVSRGEAISKRAEDLQKQHCELLASVAHDERELVKFRTERLLAVRSRAVGREWKEFVTDNGRCYLDAKIVSVDDSGVNLRHRDGSARVRFSDLNESQRCEFGLEAAHAVIADSKERERAQAYEAWVENELKVSADKKSFAKDTTFADVAPLTRPVQLNESIEEPRTGALATAPRRLNTRANSSYRQQSSVYYYLGQPCYPRVYLYRRPKQLPVIPGRPGTPNISNPTPGPAPSIAPAPVFTPVTSSSLTTTP